MPSYQLLVPSRETPDALTAFRAMLPGASWLHGAVAFVSQRGVDLLAGVLEELGTPTLKVVVRGAPITDPQAVLELDDRLGAEVRVVLGERAPGFHPKLWISQTEEATWVLSGSGNLTAGGLRDNDEQFELLRFSRTQPGARAQGSAHMTRWNRFYEGGLPLADAIRTDAWTLWETQRAELETLQARARALDRELATARTPQSPAREVTVPRPRGNRLFGAGWKVGTQTLSARSYGSSWRRSWQRHTHTSPRGGSHRLPATATAAAHGWRSFATALRSS
jgi:HKD family nuclease